MIGAIIGDIVGSIYEFDPIISKEFDLFTRNNEITDDGILTIAIFTALEKCKGSYEKLSVIAAKELIASYAKYPMPLGGYGSMFVDWVLRSLRSYRVKPPYNSFGNGAAMRVSPVAYFAGSMEECIDLSKKVTEITHNHEEGIKGAEATAATIYMALNKHTKEEIRDYINTNYYSLNETCDQIRLNYRFDGSCQGSVPQSIQAFLEATSYEDAIRNVISLGGDADTMAAITGAIAEAYFGIPEEIELKMFDYLDNNLKEKVIKMKEKSENVILTKRR